MSPERVERALASHLVEQIFVHGEGTESFLVAVVVPAEVGGAGAGAGVPSRAAILLELQKRGREAGLSKFELVKDVFLEKVPFSAENGLLTPTFKMKRQTIRDRYRKEIDTMYKRNKSKL